MVSRIVPGASYRWIYFGVLVFSFTFYLFQWGANENAVSEAKTEEASLSPAHISPNIEQLSLLPGDLPGYTGWARPSMTLSREFHAVRSTTNPKINDFYELKIECRHSLCEREESLFYVRAYGPAVLAGNVKSLNNGTYTITIGPLYDAGRYTLEVVLTFSRVPNKWYEQMPFKEDPAYEGYPLLHVPTSFTVTGTQPQVKVLTDCKAENLFAGTGRWKLSRKNVLNPYSQNTRGPTLPGYQSGNNSIGFTMEYVRPECHLLTLEELQEPTRYRLARESSSSIKMDTTIHAVMVGDSNMLAQSERLKELMKNRRRFQVTRVSTSLGLPKMWEAISGEVREIGRQPNTQFVVLVNSGMHDIYQLCSPSMRTEREGYLNETELGMSCLDLYRNYLERLVVLLQRELKPISLVWESTTAGWPKWGNYGAKWGPSHAQGLTTSPHPVEHWNSLASSIMKRHHIPSLDAYWLTLARPDHREVSDKNDLGAKLAHAGVEVYPVLIREWATIFLQALAET